jgi:hypothetical protein
MWESGAQSCSATDIASLLPDLRNASHEDIIDMRTVIVTRDHGCQSLQEKTRYYDPQTLQDAHPLPIGDRTMS